MLSTTTSTVVPVPLLELVVATLVNVPDVLFTVATSNVRSAAPPAPNNASITVCVSPTTCPVPGMFAVTELTVPNAPITMSYVPTVALPLLLVPDTLL